MKRYWKLVAVIFLASCSGRPGRVSPPRIDAATAAAKAIEQYDRNGDGTLSADELVACPALLYAMPRFDSDHNHALSKSEIEAGIDRWKTAGIGARSVPFRVQLDGRPLDGALVKITPEPFLDGAIASATGETKRGGGGFLAMAAADLPRNALNMPLVQPGLYRVEITHATQKIPSKYNSNTTLGLEVARDSIAPEGILWNLTKGK